MKTLNTNLTKIGDKKMNTYRCTLIQTINGKKLVKKVFYKKGHTTKEIEENLAMFEWDSKGK
jgi:hypothetical protein